MAHLETEIAGAPAAALPLTTEEDPPRLRFLAHTAGGNRVELTDARPELCLAALLLVADRWVVLAAREEPELAVNHVAVVGFKVLDHGDTIELPGLRLRLSEERVEVLADGARLILQQKACPVCQRRFAAGDRVLHCPRCNLAHHTAGAAQHGDCWSFNGRCASSPFCGSYQRRGAASAAAPEAAR